MFDKFKELQEIQPWTDLWSEEFRNDPRSYKDFEHCLINIVAKVGAILQRVEMADHYGRDYQLAFDKDKDADALGYIIMSALKAANTHPDGKIDISGVIKRDLTRRGALGHDHGT